MGLRRYGAALLFGVMAWNCPVTLADTTTVESSSTSSFNSFWDKVSEKATLSYFGIYRGASLGDIGNSLQPAVDGTPDPTNPQSVENLITAGYKIDRDWTIGGVAHFNYFPIGLPANSGQNIQMLDPILYIQRTNIVNQGGFKVTGRFWTSFQLTEADTLGIKNLAAYLSPVLITNYDVPHTSLTVGLFTYIRAYIPNPSAGDNALTYKFYVAPTANYQLTQSVALTLWVDLVQATRYGGSGFIGGMRNPSADIEPGISWDITKNITINPILNIYPSNPTLAATSLQAFIIAKAF